MSQKRKLFQGLSLHIALAICFLILAMVAVVFLSYQDFDLFQAQGSALSSYSGSKYLSVSVSGKGIGNVLGSPEGINCGNGGKVCKYYFDKDTSITLSATPGSNSVFVGWTGGACSGSNNPCIVKLNTSKSTSARFDALSKANMITTSTSGMGSGRVISTPMGIECPGRCWMQINRSVRNVSLSAKPNSSSKFVKWSGNCERVSGNVCSFTYVQGDKNINAEFCSDECTHYNEIRCVGTATYQICKYDKDNKCLAWDTTNIATCTGKTNCGYGRCTSSQKPNWYCTNNICAYTCYNSSTCK